MKINREVFIKVLEAVRPGLSKKAIIDQAQNFVFTGNEVITYNDRVCVIHPFETDFFCSVASEELYKIVSNIKADEIDLNLVDGQLIIKAKGTKARLVTGDGNNIIDMVQALDLESVISSLNPLPEDFIEAISMCIFSASKDTSTPAMTGLYINENKVASTDDLRISEYMMKEKVGSTILLPATAAAELIKFKAAKYALTDKWAFFLASEDVFFCCRIMAPDEFPDYEGFLGDVEDTEIKIPEEAEQMIATAAILSSGEMDQDKEIGVEIKSGIIKIVGANAGGSVETETKIDTRDEMSFIINPFFMLKILEHTRSMYYGGSKVLFRSDKFRHAISLKGFNE